MYPTMTRRRELLALVAVLALFLSLLVSIPAVTAAAPNVATGDGIVVDGDAGEWQAGDFFADMYRAGDATKEVESTLSLRYDCDTGVLYVLVLTASGVDIIDSDADNFVKFGDSDKRVDGSDAPADGTQPDFEYLPDGSGWEASFSVTPGTYADLNVHAQVEDGGSQTSAVQERAISITIACPTPTVTPTPTAVVTPTPVVTATPTSTPAVTATPTPEGTPDSEISKSASVSEIAAGGSYDYTMTVVNDGSALATGVTVTDNLDNDLIVNSVTPSKGSCDAVASGNLITCHIGDLVVDEVATVVVNVTAPAAACPSVDNRASVTADNEFNNEGDLEVSHSQVVIVDVICETQTATPTPTPEGSEAGSTSTPTATATATATPEGSQQGSTGTPAPTRTPEGGVAAATGTPAGGNLPNTASGTPLTTPLVAFGFGLLLLGSIGTLAYANVAANRRRR